MSASKEKNLFFVKHGFEASRESYKTFEHEIKIAGERFLYLLLQTLTDKEKKFFEEIVDIERLDEKERVFFGKICLLSLLKSFYVDGLFKRKLLSLQKEKVTILDETEINALNQKLAVFNLFLERVFKGDTHVYGLRFLAKN